MSYKVVPHNKPSPLFVRDLRFQGGCSGVSQRPSRKGTARSFWHPINMSTQLFVLTRPYDVNALRTDTPFLRAKSQRDRPVSRLPSDSFHVKVFKPTMMQLGIGWHKQARSFTTLQRLAHPGGNLSVQLCTRGGKFARVSSRFAGASTPRSVLLGDPCGFSHVTHRSLCPSTAALSLWRMQSS